MKNFSAQRIREYQARINQVTDYIDAHLAKTFSLEELAHVACFSKYHFHRIFHAIIGETLFSYIQRRRLERAAGLLVINQDEPVTSIALESGFSSSSAFVRAFKKKFGMTAGQWRKNKKRLYDREKKDMEFRPMEFSFSRVEGRVDIRDMDPLTLAYIRYTGPYEADAGLFQHLYKKLYHWAVPRDLISDGTKHLTIYHDHIDITGDDKLRISACVSIPPKTRVSGEVGKMTLSGGRYACARFCLGSQDFYQAWQWLYSDWLFQSGYQPADGPGYEYYPFLRDEAGVKKKMTVDICIPVQPI